MIGVRYIHARSTIWYISETSGKKTANVEMINPIPKVKAANNSNTKGKNNTLQWGDVPDISIITKSGTSDKTILTSPVPTEEIANDVRGR